MLTVKVFYVLGYLRRRTREAREEKQKKNKKRIQPCVVRKPSSYISYICVDSYFSGLHGTGRDLFERHGIVGCSGLVVSVLE